MVATLLLPLTSREIVLVECLSDLAIVVYDSPFFNLFSMNYTFIVAKLYILVVRHVSNVLSGYIRLSKNPLNHGAKIETCLY